MLSNLSSLIMRSLFFTMAKFGKDPCWAVNAPQRFRNYERSYDTHLSKSTLRVIFKLTVTTT